MGETGRANPEVNISLGCSHLPISSFYLLYVPYNMSSLAKTGVCGAQHDVLARTEAPKGRAGRVRAPMF